MTKKEICIKNKSFAYISACRGIEFKKIEHGIDDYIYFTANSWSGKKSYHKSKVYYNINGDSYIKLNGTRYHLNEAIRI